MNIDKINRVENKYNTTSRNLSFKSKFVPNEALKEAFFWAKNDCKYPENLQLGNGVIFAKVMKHLLNDGKDDLIKLTKGSKISTLIINGARKNVYPPSYRNSDLATNGDVVNNVVDYFVCKKNIVDPYKLTQEEIEAIKPSIKSLNSSLNTDTMINNPLTLVNLQESLSKVMSDLNEYSLKVLKEIEDKIFKN